METNFQIRLIKESDNADAIEIYKPYVLSTSITFEYDVPTTEDFLDRIKNISNEYPWLVCLKNNKIAGYAYATKHRYRSAYQWSPESTIYLSAEIHGKGIARILYETLFSILRLQGHFNVYAGVVVPNKQSEGFHRSLGFSEIGDFKKVGYKSGEWHDVKWFQLHLREHFINPLPPVSITEIQKKKEFKEIMIEANNRMKKIK